MALCSLSTGKSRPPRSATSDITSSPATTSVSLLARATVLPASRAAHVHRIPAAPTTAETTTSTSGDWTRRATSSGRVRNSTPGSNSPGSPSPSTSATHSGRNRAAWAKRSSRRDRADSPTTSNRSGRPEITSSVLVPIDPVEPRTTTRGRRGRPVGGAGAARGSVTTGIAETRKPLRHSRIQPPGVTSRPAQKKWRVGPPRRGGPGELYRGAQHGAARLAATTVGPPSRGGPGEPYRGAQHGAARLAATTPAQKEDRVTESPGRRDSLWSWLSCP